VRLIFLLPAKFFSSIKLISLPLLFLAFPLLAIFSSLTKRFLIPPPFSVSPLLAKSFYSMQPSYLLQPSLVSPPLAIFSSFTKQVFLLQPSSISPLPMPFFISLAPPLVIFAVASVFLLPLLSPIFPAIQSLLSTQPSQQAIS